MHAHSLDRFTHEHVFLGARHERNERRVWLVVGLTFAMMVAEITGGTMFGSLALVADGWHMSTHAAALSISALAYLYARRHARDPRFAFGTGKLGDLAGFASAIVLAMIALLIGYESVTRLVHPVPIAYREAVAIAAVGLLVNLASAWLLGDEHDHHHGHDHPTTTTRTTTPTTTTCARPTSTSWPTRPPPCSPSSASRRPGSSAGRSWTPWSAWSARP